MPVCKLEQTNNSTATEISRKLYRSFPTLLRPDREMLLEVCFAHKDFHTGRNECDVVARSQRGLRICQPLRQNERYSKLGATPIPEISKVAAVGTVHVMAKFMDSCDQNIFPFVETVPVVSVSEAYEYDLTMVVVAAADVHITKVLSHMVDGPLVFVHDRLQNKSERPHEFFGFLCFRVFVQVGYLFDAWIGVVLGTKICP